jgi:hypothetical protein
VAVVASLTIEAVVLLVELAALLTLVNSVILVNLFELVDSLKAELLLAVGELAEVSIAACSGFEPVLAKFLLVVRAAVVFLGFFTRGELHNLLVGVELRGTEGLLSRSKSGDEVLRDTGRSE